MMTTRQYIRKFGNKEKTIVVEYDEHDTTTITREALEELLAGQCRPFFPVDDD